MSMTEIINEIKEDITSEKPKSGKGHPNYYKCKKIDYEKFKAAYDAWARHEISMYEAARRTGVCPKTFTKYVGMMWEGQELPEGLWK